MLPPYQSSSGARSKTTITIPTVRHPLEPLRAEEIAAAIAILRASGKAPAKSRFLSISLQEPSKEFVLHHKPNESIEREAVVIIQNPQDGSTYESLVSISKFSIKEWNKQANPTPSIARDEISSKDLSLMRAFKPENVSLQMANFLIKDHSIKWGCWNFRSGFNPKEGFVLFGVGFDSTPIVYRTSLRDIVGSKIELKELETASVGTFINSLSKPSDTKSDIRFSDGLLINSHGEIMRVPNALAFYEETSFQGEVKASPRLVMTFGSTLEDKEYTFCWYFYPEGTFQSEIFVKAKDGTPSKHLFTLRPANGPWFKD